LAWRNVYVSKQSKLSLKQNNLIIKLEEEFKVPIEDISTIMIESQMVTLTSALISKLTENNVIIYICDYYHLPNSVILPMNNHSRYLKMIEFQLGSSKPFKKRLWQMIVIEKILNQAKVLEFVNKESYKKLHYYSSLVDSGDTGNIESIAANHYFKILFQNEFSRREENTFNIALNYGYSIIRSAIARSLVAYGFLPVLGVHHHSELNNFNLVDDIIEPYRQIVDLWVIENVNIQDEFNTFYKVKLYNLLNYNILIDNKVNSVLNAIELTVKSLSTAFRLKDYSHLLLPSLLQLEEHTYE
jgi:CRISP-associated protein Cas1